ncbi:hypothetical protein BDR22DRAFT_555579 [Usnea florida]
MRILSTCFAMDAMTLSTSDPRLNNAVIHRKKLIYRPSSITYFQHIKCNNHKSEESQRTGQLSSLLRKCLHPVQYIQAFNFFKPHSAVSLSYASSYQIHVNNHLNLINDCHPNLTLTSSPARLSHGLPNSTIYRLESQRPNQQTPRLHSQP